MSVIQPTLNSTNNREYMAVDAPGFAQAPPSILPLTEAEKEAAQKNARKSYQLSIPIPTSDERARAQRSARGTTEFVQPEQDSHLTGSLNLPHRPGNNWNSFSSSEGMSDSWSGTESELEPHSKAPSFECIEDNASEFGEHTESENMLIYNMLARDGDEQENENPLSLRAPTEAERENAQISARTSYQANEINLPNMGRRLTMACTAADAPEVEMSEPERKIEPTGLGLRKIKSAPLPSVHPALQMAPVMQTPVTPTTNTAYPTTAAYPNTGYVNTAYVNTGYGSAPTTPTATNIHYPQGYVMGYPSSVPGTPVACAQTAPTVPQLCSLTPSAQCVVMDPNMAGYSFTMTPTATYPTFQYPSTAPSLTPVPVGYTYATPQTPVSGADYLSDSGVSVTGLNYQGFSWSSLPAMSSATPVNGIQSLQIPLTTTYAGSVCGSVSSATSGSEVGYTDPNQLAASQLNRNIWSSVRNQAPPQVPKPTRLIDMTCDQTAQTIHKLAINMNCGDNAARKYYKDITQRNITGRQLRNLTANDFFVHGWLKDDAQRIVQAIQDKMSKESAERLVEHLTALAHEKGWGDSVVAGACAYILDNNIAEDVMTNIEPRALRQMRLPEFTFEAVLALGRRLAPPPEERRNHKKSSSRQRPDHVLAYELLEDLEVKNSKSLLPDEGTVLYTLKAGAVIYSEREKSTGPKHNQTGRYKIVKVVKGTFVNPQTGEEHHNMALPLKRGEISDDGKKSESNYGYGWCTAHYPKSDKRSDPLHRAGAQYDKLTPANNFGGEKALPGDQRIDSWEQVFSLLKPASQ